MVDGPGRETAREDGISYASNDNMLLNSQRKPEGFSRSKTSVVKSGFHLPPINSNRVGIVANNFISDDEEKDVEEV